LLFLCFDAAKVDTFFETTKHFNKYLLFFDKLNAEIKKRLKTFGFSLDLHYLCRQI